MQKAYRIRVKEFVIKLVSQRQYLLRNNKSQITNPLFVLKMEEVRNNAAFLTGDPQSKNFLLRNADLLRSIIPGKMAKCHESLNKQLDELINFELNN